MNVGTRLLLSAALAVGSTVGAAALGQTVVRDAQAEVGPSSPTAAPAPAAPALAPAASAPATSAPATPLAEAALPDAASTETAAAGDALADVAWTDDRPPGADGDADADVRAAGVRAELAAAAEAGEISWDAAHRVSDELGGYIRGDRSLGEIPTAV